MNRMNEYEFGSPPNMYLPGMAQVLPPQPPPIEHATPDNPAKPASCAPKVRAAIMYVPPLSTFRVRAQPTRRFSSGPSSNTKWEVLGVSHQSLQRNAGDRNTQRRCFAVLVCCVSMPSLII